MNNIIQGTNQWLTRMNAFDYFGSLFFGNVGNDILVGSTYFDRHQRWIRVGAINRRKLCKRSVVSIFSRIEKSKSEEIVILEETKIIFKLGEMALAMEARRFLIGRTLLNQVTIVVKL